VTGVGGDMIKALHTCSTHSTSSGTNAIDINDTITSSTN
jgi:hypothetical protein